MARTYRCTLQAHYSDGTLVEPSLHYQTDLPDLGDEPDPSDVATGIWGHLGAEWQESCPTYVHIDSLVVTEMVVPPLIGVGGEHVVNADGTGSAGAEDLPRELVPLVNVHTDTRSRSARGNLRLAGVGDKSKIIARTFQAAYVTAVYTPFINKIPDEIDLGSLVITRLNPVVYSRTRHLRGETPYTFRVVGASLNPKPKWLRSRGTSP